MQSVRQRRLRGQGEEEEGEEECGEGNDAEEVVVGSAKLDTAAKKPAAIAKRPAGNESTPQTFPPKKMAKSFETPMGIFIDDVMDNLSSLS